MFQNGHNRDEELLKQLFLNLFKRFPFIADNEETADYVTKAIEYSIRKHLNEKVSDNPFLVNRRIFEDIQDQTRANNTVTQELFSRARAGYENLYKIAGAQLDTKDFWKQEEVRLFNGHCGDNASISFNLLLQSWGKDLLYFELTYLKEELLAYLSPKIEVLSIIQGHLERTGFGSNTLFALTGNSFRETDLDSLEQTLAFLEQNEEWKQICDILGELRNIEHKEQIESEPISVNAQQTIPDYNSREEVTGLRAGKDLSSLVPQELQMLESEESEMLFYKKFAEAHLLCFDIQGYACDSLVKDDFASVTNMEEKQGPMIICVDTSGSMVGVPEVIAKSVTLAMALRAREQGRDCFLINFSTEVITFDLSSTLGLEDLKRFLQLSFHGATDLAPALRHALNKIKELVYKKADVLVISDFIMESLPQSVIRAIEILRGSAGNRFHALIIGDRHSYVFPYSIFEHIWHYDISRRDISILKNVTENPFRQ